ncbi:Na+/H+ antiporter NhaA [Pseudoalteromonas sp. GCY]|uniref:Na+/H+ antiporter NhaA n=1 Tax=Pseudoalteromonas sp. GCY TaxID=2003316 RepID=UPI000BFF0448|nr:Na+/H+ antiporter NhaA [Pseudoalteromonas sp. GCY]PHI38982.1 Na+/H+ antiporter NhaA [Pseudoalteromonas sp. GCY]QQQ65287.1 Na+/H+ antiporter NhaA [Pseudoalteromonas sp. GCY]
MRDKYQINPSQLAQLPKEHIDWFIRPITRFIKVETAAGAILLLATIIALLFANSELSASYSQFWDAPVGISFKDMELKRSLHGWINDGAMTVFFFLVSLELKRELVLGELRSPKLAMFSISAAIGGMLIPALIYVLLQYGGSELHGWGTVMSTDTAFVIGCLALLGGSIPKALRVFMLSLAVVDDIGAILVVAIGYGESIDWLAIGIALVGLIVVKIMSFIGVRSFPLFFIAGGLIWLAVDMSGIHPTITGVALGLMTPTTKWVDDERLHRIMQCVLNFPLEERKSGDTPDRRALKTAEAAAREALSPVERLEILLHPWVGFVVMPLFALANAGIVLKSANFMSSLTLTVLLSFLIGKPLGITLFSWVAVKTRLAKLPEGLAWNMVCGGSMLAGIGFTMALFIADLAYSAAQVNSAKLGILFASVISALLGCIVLKYISMMNAKKVSPVGHHTSSTLVNDNKS